MEKISVIVPVYNTELYIEQCVLSLVNQTYTNLEIIIIDDGSTDNSYELIEKWQTKDKRIKVYRFEENRGVGYARNFGVNKAEGKYIFFIDSDDYLPENTLSILIEHIGLHDMICGKIKNTNISSSSTEVFDGVISPMLFDEDRFNLLKNLTSTNYLIRKNFIQKYNLQHSESTMVYSDLYFMLPALLHIESVPKIKEAIYFKRKRNDPILNPSLSQSNDEILINSFLNIYIDLKGKYENSLVQQFLDVILLNYYRKNIVTAIKNGYSIEKSFHLLCDAVGLIDFSVLKQYKWPLTSEIKVIKANKLNKYIRILKRHQFLRNVKQGIKSPRKFYVFLYQNFLVKLPLKKDLIFFESFLGKTYSDSPKYIYEYMYENNMNYKYVWCFVENKNIPGPAKQVKRFSIKYFYYLARAKYWVSNSRLPIYLNKREGNIYLQTWHGTPLKMLVFDMKDIYSADPNYKSNFYKQSRRWDYLSSANQYSSTIFRRAFQFEKELLEYGYPRNDILYNKNNEKDIISLKNKLELPLDKKVILYAPTWRDDEYYDKGKYKFSLKLELDKMQQKLGDQYIVLLRTHYFIADSLDLTPYNGFAYDFSKYEDIAELYLVSDILITDYSSVFFDYANLKRPILFYTYDLDKYRDQLRGFYLDIETEVPGPLLKTTDEVIHSIKNIDQINVQFKDKYEEFYNRFCKWDDGTASEKTVKRVFN